MLRMPFGRYRGKRLSDVAFDLEYVDWLLRQRWFERRYPVLYERFRSDPLLMKISAIEQQKLRYATDRARQLRAARQIVERAREERWLAERLAAHRLQYQPGIWPMGKYKSQPVAIVARDTAYCRWFAGSLYAALNAELTADLKVAIEQLRTHNGNVTVEAVEGCTVYRPASWASRQDAQTAPHE
jgi:uncharacterized protein (DUF3820 family)